MGESEVRVLTSRKYQPKYRESRPGLSKFAPSLLLISNVKPIALGVAQAEIFPSPRIPACPNRSLLSNSIPSADVLSLSRY